MIEAVSFDDARSGLYTALEGYTFARVIRKPKIPENGQEMDISGKNVITYYHCIAITCVDNRRVWFKKQVDEAQITLGAFELKTDCNYLPKIGDIIMGKMVKDRKNKDNDGGENYRFVEWYPYAKCIQTLFELVKNGTQAPEAHLIHALKTHDGKDDVFALVKLILFGNMQIFADQHLNVKVPRELKLSTPPLEFVYYTSKHLDDKTIWDAFVQLVPNAVAPEMVEPPAPPEPVIVVKPFIPKPKNVHPVIASFNYNYDEEYDPENPKMKTSFINYKYVEPVSPPYNPNTPSPPDSPNYSPVSPKYSPPKYSPVDDGFSPGKKKLRTEYHSYCRDDE